MPLLQVCSFTCFSLYQGGMLVIQHCKYEREPRYADQMAMLCLVHYIIVVHYNEWLVRYPATELPSCVSERLGAS